ncbi:MAG: beta-propeller domain-containing protein, partial [Candidatus Izimaplasma sp.]|nr:beta-propeller domain-containing protein [Candidatus Izimaplasma bacterium]
KIDNDLYVVTNNYIPFYIEDVDIDSYLSKYTVNGVETVALYEDIIYVDGLSPDSFTTFYGINLDTTEVDMETVLGDSGYNLYVSNENMYLVGDVYYFWPMVDYVDVEEPVYESKTAIMKVSIGDGEVEYKETGTINGYVLNQFSMDEYDGYLRITTTEGWGKDTNNRLYILDEDLVVVSKLEKLGKPNEQIKSTRFVGNYAYLVTFEQTDPFYVINLTDPTAPVVEGELLIPGFSTYLQPLGEDFMLGIGYGDNSGGTQGLKISIYDISDKSNPVVFDEIIFDYSEHGWASSTVTYNHKDLLVSLSKGIIALPFTTYNFNDDGYSYGSGILVYNINLETGFTFNGYVTHAVDLADEESAYDVYVYKSKFIDEYFYTISNKYIKVSTIEDTQTIINSIDLD